MTGLNQDQVGGTEILFKENYLPVISGRVLDNFLDENLEANKKGKEAMERLFRIRRTFFEDEQPFFLDWMKRDLQIPGRQTLPHHILDSYELLQRSALETDFGRFPEINQLIFDKVFQVVYGTNDSPQNKGEEVASFVERVNPKYFEHGVSFYNSFTGNQEIQNHVNRTLALSNLFYLSLNEQVHWGS